MRSGLKKHDCACAPSSAEGIVIGRTAISREIQCQKEGQNLGRGVTFHPEQRSIVTSGTFDAEERDEGH
jgi:hypothetical protein